MGQCKHCGSEVKEGMRFCGNCGAPQEAAEPEAKAEATGELAAAAGQEASGEDRNPAPTAAIGGVAKENTATVAEENAVMFVEENAAATAGESGTEGQEAPDEAVHPAVPIPTAETTGESVATATGENAPTAVEESGTEEREAPGEAMHPASGRAVGEVSEESAATATEENAVMPVEESTAAGQEAPGEPVKRKSRRLRTALFAAVAVTVAAVGAAVLLHRMTAMTGERFVRVQAEALRQEAAPFEGLGTVFENGFSSDFVLSMQMSRSRLLALSRSGNEDYMLVAKALQRGIQAKVDFGRHLETAVLNLEFGTDDSAKLNFDCFLDSEKFGYRIPQVGKQVFVLNYPEVLGQYSGGTRFSTAELAALVPSKELLSASAARYGRVLAAAVKPEEIKVKKRAYTSHVLKRQLDHEMKGAYTVYTWNPNRETLETLFRSLAAEMREDKDFADWYNKRQEAGEELATALGMGRGKAAGFSDVADYVEKHAADWAETLEKRNLRWKLVMQGKEVAAIRVVDNGERPLFCYERDQVGDTLYHGVGGEVFLGTFAEERSKKENSYEGRVIGRLAMFGDAWLWGFRLYYSKVPLDGKPSVLGLPNGSYRYTYFDADRPDRKYTFEVKEKWGRSVYELDDGYDKFTLTATRKGSAEKPTGREVDISDELSGSGGKSLPQEKFSDIIEKL